MLMGADHLCALAVVAAPGESDVQSDRSPRHLKTAIRSLVLGVRWGTGHALGLALVCVVFFSAKGSVNLDSVGVVADKIVGASMVFLGVLALAQLYRWRLRRAIEKKHLSDPLVDSADTLEEHAVGRAVAQELKMNGVCNGSSINQSIAVCPHSAEHKRAHELNQPHVHRDDYVTHHAEIDVEQGSPEGLGSPDGSSPDSSRDSSDVRSKWSTAIGFSHGVASPSGILSVLPAVVLDDHGKASAYLITFLLTSTASMGAFALLFGLLASVAQYKARGESRRSDAPTRVAMALNLFAGVSAVAIGIAWLVLSSLGKLGDL